MKSLKKNWITMISCVFTGTVVTLMGNNCSRNGFQVQNSTVENSDLASLGSADFVDDTKSIEGRSLTVLKGDQIYSSVIRLTNSEENVSAALKAEYKVRFSTLPETNSFDYITSPILLSVTSLAGQSCDDLVTRESALIAAQRKVFASVDFTKASVSLSDAGYTSAIDKMSEQFWGRTLTSEERTLLQNFRTEFESGFSSVDKAKVDSTAKLMMATCAGMLSSFETITF